MKADPTIHVMPTGGQWSVMTDDSSFVLEGLESRGEAIRCASKVAAEGKFTLLMIHSRDDRHEIADRSH